jgi:polysaccharide export outer membrane protein
MSAERSASRHWSLPVFALVTALGALLGASWVAAGPEDARLVSPGDVLEIAVYAGGEKQQEFTTAISADGSISAPLIGVVRLGPTVLSEIGPKLQLRYARGYYVNPQVIVNVKEYGGRVFVAGEVKRPGMYPLGQGLTALSVCDVAGGFSDYASPGHAQLSRIWNGKTQIIKLDLNQIRKGKARDLTLQDGDRLEVPRRFF